PGDAGGQRLGRLRRGRAAGGDSGPRLRRRLQERRRRGRPALRGGGRRPAPGGPLPGARRRGGPRPGPARGRDRRRAPPGRELPMSASAPAAAPPVAPPPAPLSRRKKLAFALVTCAAFFGLVEVALRTKVGWGGTWLDCHRGHPVLGWCLREGWSGEQTWT